MIDPVMTSDGHAYERVYIERWLQEHDTSPTTNAKLANVELLVPEHALRKLIEQWEDLWVVELDVWSMTRGDPFPPAVHKDLALVSAQTAIAREVLDDGACRTGRTKRAMARSVHSQSGVGV